MPETHFFNLLLDNFYAAPRSLPPLTRPRYPACVQPSTLRRIVRFMEKESRLSLPDALRAALMRTSRAKTLTPQECFRELMRTYATRGQGVVIEKTPTHTFHVPYMRALFPDALFVHLVRDPRDVFVSFQKFLDAHGKPRRSVHEFCFLWTRTVRAARVSQISTVLYEDLVQHPLEEINRVLAPQGIHVDALAEGGEQAVMRRPDEPWHANVGKAVRTDLVGGYQQTLSGREVAEIEALCGAEMHWFGYAPTVGAQRSWFFSRADAVRWLGRRCVIRVCAPWQWLRQQVARRMYAQDPV